MNANFPDYDNFLRQNFVKRNLMNANFANYDNSSIQNFVKLTL